MRYEKWNVIEDIFITEFGEERVECTELDNTMLMTIYFPEVKVTCNETGKSTMIQDCFVRYRVTSDGRLIDNPRLARTTVSKEQYINNYKHSHTHIAHTPHDYVRFTKMCLGRSPMDQTVTVLMNSYDETSWDILATETSRFLEIESIAGVPYIRIVDIVSSTTHKNPIVYNNQVSLTKADGLIARLSKFFKSYDVMMRDGISFTPNNSDVYWVMKFTEKLKEMCPDAPSSYFQEVVYKNGMLYEATDDRVSTSGGAELVFKGRHFKFKITGSELIQESIMRVIKPEVYSNIMSFIRLRNAGYEFDDDVYFL